MSGPEGADNSQKFVDILGLRTIFPLFMKTPKQAKAGPSSEELEGIFVSKNRNLLFFGYNFYCQNANFENKSIYIYFCKKIIVIILPWTNSKFQIKSH